MSAKRDPAIPSADAFAAALARVRGLLADYEPPSFDHVGDPDEAIFLCAVDHRTGYEREHLVDGAGPFGGSELMWTLGLRASRERGGWLRAAELAAVDGPAVAGAFEIAGETVADPERRAELWRDLAGGLLAAYDGRASALLEASAGRLGGPRGLLERLTRFEAYSDPLAKKSQLYAKVCERRGWLGVADPESWQVSADNVLMRLALRSGLVEQGRLERVRPATRAAFKRLALAADVPPPVLDDLLWDLGRDDPDLLGRPAGELSEPPREAGSAFY